MDENQRRLIMLLQLQIRDELNNSSSSDSDTEDFVILEMMNKRRKVHRVLHYVEEVVPGLTAQEFKAHFRYYSWE